MRNPTENVEGQSQAPRQARRRIAGIVAQYIHELSGRHHDERLAASAPVGGYEQRSGPVGPALS